LYHRPSPCCVLSVKTRSMYSAFAVWRASRLDPGRWCQVRRTQDRGGQHRPPTRRDPSRESPHLVQPHPAAFTV
jgi:hypothetical protein